MVLRVGVRGVPLLLGALAAATAVAASLSTPAFSPARLAPGGLPLFLLAGAALLLAGEAADRRPAGRRAAWLCRAAGLTWFVAEWADPGTTSSLVFTAGLVLGTACPAVVGHLALAGGPGPRGRVVRRVVTALGYAVTVGVQGIGGTVLADPVSAGCLGCPDALLPSAPAGTLAPVVRQAGLTGVVLWGVAVAALLVLDLLTGSRGGPAAVRAAALLGTGAVTVTAVHDLRRGFPGTDRPDLLGWTVQALALLALAAAVVVDVARSRRARRALARVVLDLGAGERPGGLRAALAERFADPALVLAYRVDGRLVDSGGREVPVPPARGRRAVSTITVGGEGAAVLGHRDDVLTTAEARADLAATVGLALDNEGLQAELLVQLADLERSGARIVAAGDEERRRLEQDLHDGAQQRLVALALELQLVRSLHPDHGGPELDRAEQALREAVAELRALARGVYPALLRTGGLVAALEGLAETRPLRWTGVPDGRLPDVVESTVYLLAERLSAGGWTTLDLDDSDGSLSVRAQAAAEVPLDDLAARIATLDGSVTVTADGEGTLVLVQLPLAARELT